MILLFWIGLGSAIGGSVRYLLDLLVIQVGIDVLPFSTLFINVTGSFLIGWLAGNRTTGSVATPHSYNSHFWITGICGGYTTFSTFTWQIIEMIKAGQGQEAGLYAAGSVSFGLISVWLGFSIAVRKRIIAEKFGSPIQFYSRESGDLKVEEVYGESFLRWAYGNPLGRLTIVLIVKRFWFSRWYGWRMDRPKSHSKVKSFIWKFGVDVSEFADPVESYRTFNEFFYRKLKSEARPIAANESVVAFSADGRHLAITDISVADIFYIKGQRFNLACFTDDTDLSREFEGGSILISRLCPSDYHRFHFPIDGVADPADRLPGSLRSVNPLALRRQLSILWENRRERTVLKSDLIGKVLIFEIGATCVGRIHQTYAPGSVSKGDEKGYFSFGGSCVVTLFKKNAIRFDDDLLEYSAKGIETYAKMGQRCGEMPYI